MQQTLPNNLNYNEVKPIGYPSHVRQERFTPIAFNTSTQGVSSSDVIRFNISSNGFWDPYSAYIKLEVDVSQMDGTKSGQNSSGSLQVDNSARGTEIERIEEYDTIASILNDVNCSYDNRQTRQFEGMNSQLVSGAQAYQNNVYNFTGTTLLGYNPLVSYLPDITQTIATNEYKPVAATQTAINRYENQILNIDSRNTIQQAIGTYALQGLLTNYDLPSKGYFQPHNPSLSSLGNEAILSKNLYTTTCYKGKQQQFIFADRQTFCIPLISGLLGVLMPRESYKYIPMKALQELILEFRLNPYAMFSSGYNDGATNTDNQGASSKLTMNNFSLVNRIWRITKFELVVEMQYFEPSVENVILSQLNTDRGIVIHSTSWMLGPRYQIAANAAPNGTFQVNLGFESLKNVLWCFIPDDFTTYPYCRKQYRLSANVTSMYVKIGNEYYPPLPITGHAGTPASYSSLTNDVDLNNAEFLIQLYKTFGKFHDIQNNCVVNNVNFAVNERLMNPANTTALTNAAGNAYTNFDTPMSFPLWHENRCVGRAVYALNLETLNQDYNVISGINTINNRPFEITLKADTTNAYVRSYTMYVFCQYDMLVQLRNTGVSVLGRG